MKAKFILFFIMAALLVPAPAARAQSQNDEQLQKLEEQLQEAISRMESVLKLEDWQTFYLDSILVHDYTAMYEELGDLQKKKATNTDLYYQIQDKWQDKIYDAIQGVLKEDQWSKYLKMGAGREKKEREKRAEKRLKQQK